MTEADETSEASAMPEATSRAEAMAMAEEAEAQAAEAEAMAAAARARARAARLRREALTLAEDAEDYGDAAAAAADAAAADDYYADYDETAEDYDDDEYEDEYDDEYDEATDGDYDDAYDEDGEAAPESATRPDDWRRRLPSLATTSKVAAVILIAGFAAFSVYAVLQHRDTVRYQQRQEAFVAGAKQRVLDMISLDFHRAKADVQRVIDGSTGEFKDDFENRANDFIAVVEQSKAVTEGTVNGAAVESMGDNSAVVLVAATSRVTNSPPGKDEPPRIWRLKVTITDVGGKYKMSKVEYIP